MVDNKTKVNESVTFLNESEGVLDTTSILTDGCFDIIKQSGKLWTFVDASRGSRGGGGGGGAGLGGGAIGGNSDILLYTNRTVEDCLTQ